MFFIEPMSRTPIYEQLVIQLEAFILSGALQPGEQIPSVRGLSLQLSINPNTIQKAYSEMDSRGLIHSVPGKGCFITENAFSHLQARAAQKLDVLDSLIAELILGGISREQILARIDAIFQAKGGTIS